MITRNGMTLTEATAMLHDEICAISGFDALPDGYNIAPVKAQLRAFYTATGGRRGGDYVDPTAAQYRDLFNGAWPNAGADLFAIVEAGRAKAGETKALPVPEAATMTTTMGTPDAAQVGNMLAAFLASQGGAVDERKVRAIVDELVTAKLDSHTRSVTVKVAGKPDVKIDKAHNALDEVLLYAANRIHVQLVGPAGSGKTTLAAQVAEACGLPFYPVSKVMDPVQLLGFIDGHGNYRRTTFREAFEHGGVFLLDEMDSSAADALVAFNAALAGPWCDFPDGTVKRHDDFVAIGACNTFGRGADRQYVGREQLDAATLDRFAVLCIDYDEALELAISCDADWTRHVQKIRAAVAKENMRVIVSPRASISGGVMLKAGLTRAKVEDAFIWKGVGEIEKARIVSAMRK